jgi:hypothetical protein
VRALLEHPSFPKIHKPPLSFIKAIKQRMLCNAKKERLTLQASESG